VPSTLEDETLGVAFSTAEGYPNNGVNSAKKGLSREGDPREALLPRLAMDWLDESIHGTSNIGPIPWLWIGQAFQCLT